MSDRFRITCAAGVIAAGGVVAHPTEGVFGLACDPFNDGAIERLLAVKQRSADKGFILIASDWEQLAPWCVEPPADIAARMHRSWPGAVTWLVEARAGTSSLITGHRPTIAVRITNHALSRSLCDACGHALISTSANRSGLVAPRSALGVRVQLGQRIHYVLSGPLGGRTSPTPIYDARSGTEIRGG